MPILYDNPKEVGADRIVNAVAAYERMHGRVDRGRLRHGDHLRLRHREGRVRRRRDRARASASRSTRSSRARPSCRASSWRGRRRSSARPRCTPSSRASSTATRALVDGLVARIRAEQDPNARVLATGGLARADRAALDHHRGRRRVPHPRRAAHHLRTQRRTRCQLRRSPSSATSPSSGRAAREDQRRRRAAVRGRRGHAPRTGRRRLVGLRRRARGAAPQEHHHRGAPPRHVEEARDQPDRHARATRPSCTTRATASAPRPASSSCSARPAARSRSRPRRSGAGARSSACRAIGFVTRLDRERAELEHALEDLKLLGVKPAVLQVPIGAEAGFQRRRRRALREGLRLPGRLGDHEGGGGPGRAGRRGRGGARAAGRDDRRGERRAAREVSRGHGALGGRSWRRACARGRATGKFLPVLCGAAAKGIGVHAAARRHRRPAAVAGRPAAVEGRRPARPASASSAPPIRPRRSRRSSSRPSSTRSPASSRLAHRLRARATSDLNVVNSYRDGKERLGHLLQARRQEAEPGARRRSPATSSRSRSSRTPHSGDTLCRREASRSCSRRSPTRRP